MHYQDALQAAANLDRLDAEVLLATLLRVPRSHLWAWPEQLLTATEATQFMTWVQRRAAGEPLAYIIGTKEFWSLNFAVTPATLIPRPETETLVATALQYLSPAPLTVIDLGTGSGAIAIALAHERPLWHMIAIDDSVDALQVAQLNTRTLASNSIQLLQSNWLQCCKPHSVDAIVSNPPYIAAGDPHLSALCFEPAHALVSGQQGLDDIEQILRQARYVLRPQGWLMFEHGFEQGDRISVLFSTYGYQDIIQKHDLLTHTRVTAGRTPC